MIVNVLHLIAVGEGLVGDLAGGDGQPGLHHEGRGQAGGPAQGKPGQCSSLHPPAFILSLVKKFSELRTRLITKRLLVLEEVGKCDHSKLLFSFLVA